MLADKAAFKSLQGPKKSNAVVFFEQIKLGENHCKDHMNIFATVTQALSKFSD